jgi:hypothetical protein
MIAFYTWLASLFCTEKKVTERHTHKPTHRYNNWRLCFLSTYNHPPKNAVLERYVTICYIPLSFAERYERICYKAYHELQRFVIKKSLLHSVSIRGTLCNNLLHTVVIRGTVWKKFVTKRTTNWNWNWIATLCNKKICYIASPFAERYVTICYITSRCYIRSGLWNSTWNLTNFEVFGTKTKLKMQPIDNNGLGTNRLSYYL